MTKDENVLHGAKTPESDKSSGNLNRPKSCDILVKPTTPTKEDVTMDGVPEEEPPKEPFRVFREKSYVDLLEREVAQKFKETDKKQRSSEVHLVDGELKFDTDDSSEGKEAKPDEKLVEGNPLPDDVGKFPDNLLGKPIEEIDPNIKDKTFVVIAKRIKKKFIYRFSATKAFFILSPWNPIRRIPVYIATNQFFDYFVILTIVVNCILMAAIPDSNEIPEYVFLGIYSVEMIIKLLARGFVLNKYTYLRDPWNWLDFAVIIIGYVTIIIENSTTNSNFNLSSMRTFRVLRALKTVSIIPGLRTIVNALLRAFKMLVEVITLTVFVLMIFALFALQVYMGTLRQKCVLNVVFAGYTAVDGNYDEFYANWVKNTTNWQTDDGGDYIMCGNASLSGICDSNYICLGDLGENPNHGFTGFDNFLWAMLNCFQLITLDFWEDIYDKVIRTSGPWNVLFFMAVVFLGSFYLINLMLAVVAMSYEEEAESAGKLAGAKLAQRWKAKPPDWMVKLKKKRDRDRERAKLKKKNNPIYDIAVIKVSTKKFKEATTKAKKRKENSDGENIVQVKPIETPSDEPQADKTKLSVNSGTGASTTPVSTPSSSNPHKPLVKKQSKDSGFSNRSQISSKSSGSKREIRRQESQEHLKTPHDAEERSVQSADTLRGNTNEAFEEEDTTEIDDETSEKKEDYVVITAEDENTENGQDNELIDRNWYWCQLCYCFIPWLRLQNKVYVIVSHPVFDILITIVILLNTLLMATEHHNQPDYWGQVIEIANYVFTAVFIIEAILKLTALGKFYFKSGWNIFDLLIVGASIVDLSLTNVQGLSVFRIFRLLRVFKLAQSWPTLRLLLSIIISTLGALGNLTFILLLVIYIFAVMGMQLFRKQYTADKFPSGEVPRWNFTDITHSLMLIFRVLCGEWVEPLWDCMLAADESCMLVFLAALVFGNFMVLNLFLAMLLNAFASDVLKKNSSETEGGGILSIFKKIRTVFCGCSCCKRSRTGSVGPSGGKLDETENSDVDKESKELEMKTVNGGLTTEVQEEKIKTTNSVFIHNINNKENHTPNGVTAKDKGESDPDEDIKLGDDASTIKKEEESKIVVVEDCLPAWMVESCKCCWLRKSESSNFWRRWHTFRKVMCVIVDHKVFEGLILLIIGLSSLSLAFEDAYLLLNPQLEMALKYLDYIFFVIFAVEMFMKWIAYGLKKYFTTFWTILDFGIVAVSCASLITEATGLANIGAFRSLRTLRAFRPLRAISRWQSMKIVVNALMMAIPSIFNVLLVCLVFWLIFSIMGVQFFAGKFFKCVDASGVRLDASIIPDKTTCLANGYLWMNSKINFDNVFQGLLALLQVATFEGWIEVMVDAVDITGVDLQPRNENTLISYLFFVIFIIFGSFFTLNLFIGVIIDNFNMLKKKYEGGYLDAFLTPSQRNYYNTLKKLGTKKPQKTIKRPKNKWQAFFYDISTSSKFELAIVAVIFTNMIVMGIDHYNQTQVVTDTLDIMNIVYTSVFALEAAIKLIGLRWHYFRQAWNVFDFIVVLLSLLGIILDDILSAVFITPTLLRVVRVFRIGRVLRLIKAAKGIRKLLFALVISLPALFNIGALLFLVLYIYAIIGMSTFMNVKLVGFFNDLVNFKTFLNSFVLLFRLATSAGWNEILDALLVQPPDCTEALGDCGIPWFATLYMVSYIIIIFLIVINTYIAVILENFSQAHEQEEVGITEDDFEMFYVVWERYDPLATQFIKYEQLQDFVADLEEPLCIEKPNEIALVSFDLPIVEGDKLHCLDILMALVKNVLGKVEQTEELEQLQTQMELKFQETFPTRVKTIIKSSTMQRKKEDVAAKTLQRAWRGYKAQKQLRTITGMAMLNVNATGGPHSRSNSVVSLGRRLSNALSSFFNTSRPSSAVSRRSAVSVASTISPRTGRTKNLQVS